MAARHFKWNISEVWVVTKLLKGSERDLKGVFINLNREILFRLRQPHFTALISFKCSEPNPLKVPENLLYNKEVFEPS